MATLGASGNPNGNPDGNGPPHFSPHFGRFGNTGGTEPTDGGSSGPPHKPYGGDFDDGHNSTPPHSFEYYGPKPMLYKPKMDAKAYPVLKDNKYFYEWNLRTRIVLNSHGMGHILDYDYAYAQLPPEQALDRHRRTNAIFALLFDIVKTDTGKEILRAYGINPHSSAIYEIFQQLQDDAHQSISGKVAITELLGWLTSNRYDPSKGLSVPYLIEWMKSFRQHNRICPPEHRLSDTLGKALLAVAVSDCKDLALVQSREREHSANPRENFEEYSLDTYYDLLKAVGSQLDLSRRAYARRRSANIHDIDLADEADGYETELDTMELQAHAMDSQPTGPRPGVLPSSQFRQLPEADRKLWLQFSDEGRKIMAPNAPTSSTKRSVHFAESQDPDSPSNEEPMSEASVDDSPTVVDVNQASSASAPAKKPTFQQPDKSADAHPADPRRLLSTKHKKSPPPRKVRNATVSPSSPSNETVFAQLEDSNAAKIASYWASAAASDEATSPPKTTRSRRAFKCKTTPRDTIGYTFRKPCWSSVHGYAGGSDDSDASSSGSELDIQFRRPNPLFPRQAGMGRYQGRNHSDYSSDDDASDDDSSDF